MSALAAIDRQVNDVADYPNPDLAIEVDISVPRRTGRASTPPWASEFWIFDGETLTIERLGRAWPLPARRAEWFPAVRADQVPRWLLDEDLSDYDAWTRRVREWAAKELHGQ